MVENREILPKILEEQIITENGNKERTNCAQKLYQECDRLLLEFGYREVTNLLWRWETPRIKVEQDRNEFEVAIRTKNFARKEKMIPYFSQDAGLISIVIFCFNCEEEFPRKISLDLYRDGRSIINEENPHSGPKEAKVDELKKYEELLNFYRKKIASVVKYKCSK